MNQDAVRPEDRRPLEQAVEQQAQGLEHVGEVLQQPGSKEGELRQAVKEVSRQADEVKRELGRQDAGTLSEAEDAAGPETAPHEPIGGLG